eukprot:1504198-Pyramimonas_sp.AAC.1
MARLLCSLWKPRRGATAVIARPSPRALELSRTRGSLPSARARRAHDKDARASRRGRADAWRAGSGQRERPRTGRR